MTEGRYQRARRLGIKDGIIKAPFDLDTNDRIAVAAEHFILDPYGVALVDEGPGSQGWKHDWSVERQHRGRVIVSCGDVKWTPRQDGGLMVPFDKVARHRCLVYALVVGDPTKGEPLRLVGWTWGHRLAATPATSKSPTVPAHYLAQEDLMPPDSFVVTMAVTFGLTK